MTDKGFAVKEFCAAKGIFHNRSPVKFSEQFSQVETADYFDVASLRIHVERFIVRVRGGGGVF